MHHKASALLGLLFTTLFVTSCDEPHAPEPAQSPSPADPALAVASNTWITRAPLPVERRDLTVTAVIPTSGQSTLYAIGGRLPSGASVGRVDAYNVATNSWTRKAQLPLPVYQTNGAGVINGKIYVSGGFVKFTSPLSALMVYDPATNTWTNKRDMPITSQAGLTGVIDNKLFVLTSCPFDDHCTPHTRAAFFRYDPAMDQWTSLPLPNPLPSYFPSKLGGTIGKKLYVSGGSAGLSVYDPATNQWSTKTPSPPGCGFSASATHAAKLYLFHGGPCPTGVYDPASDSWTTKTAMPNPRSGFAATRVVLNDASRIHVVGGASPSNQAYIP